MHQITYYKLYFIFYFFNYYFTISRDYSHFSLLTSLLSQTRPDRSSHLSLLPNLPLSRRCRSSPPPLLLASSSTRHKRRRRSSLIARNYDVLSSVLFVFVRFEKQQQALIIRKLQGKPHFAPFLTSLHLLLSDSKLYCHVI